jgi:hypothetical protein
LCDLRAGSFGATPVTQQSISAGNNENRQTSTGVAEPGRSGRGIHVQVHGQAE